MAAIAQVRTELAALRLYIENRDARLRDAREALRLQLVDGARLMASASGAQARLVARRIRKTESDIDTLRWLEARDDARVGAAFAAVGRRLRDAASGAPSDVVGGE